MSLDTQTIEKLLAVLPNKRVVVIGDFMLDRYVWGRVSRISPEAPVPIIDVTKDDQRPGGAGNVVLNLTSLGAKCSAVGLIGDDKNGDELSELLQQSGADTIGLIKCDDRPTTVKTRVIAEKQQVVRVDREKTHSPDNSIEKRLEEKISEILVGADALILQDYNKGVMTKRIIRYAIEKANELNIPITVDPKSSNFFEYYGVTVFKPNLREAEGALNHRMFKNRDVEQAGSELLLRLQSESVLITRGSDGMSLFEKNKSVKNIPTRALHISDVSGAGDTVISSLTLGIACGLNLYDSALLATMAAGYVVGRVGVVPITPEALLTESGD